MDYEDAQAHLSLRWAHMSEGTTSYDGAEMYLLRCVPNEHSDRLVCVRVVWSESWLVAL